MKTEGSYKSADGRSSIHYECYAPEGEPKVILQIIHGMCDYFGRYAHVAEYLNGYGVLVCGEDHIGHGYSASGDDWGYMGKENGWENMVEDIHQLRTMVQQQYPGVPYVMMGHSMGSFLIRAYLAKHAEGLAEAVIMGTSGKNPAAAAGLTMTKLIRKLKGDRHRSKLLTGIAFGANNKKIQNAKTPDDWISRDDEVIKKYMQDPRDTFIFTTSGYQELMEVLIYINSDEWYRSIAKDLPIWVVAGEEDPVGEYGKGPKEVADGLAAQGCKVTLKLYPGMRHELHNEIGKEAFLEDLRDFVLAAAK